MTLTINFATQKFVSDFEAVPANEYKARVDKVEVRLNKEGDAEYLWGYFTIIDEDGEFDGRKVTRQLMLAMKGAADNMKQIGWRIQQMIEGFCLPVDDSGFVFGYDPETFEWSGFVVLPTDDENVRTLAGFQMEDGTFIPTVEQILEIRLNEFEETYQGETRKKNSLKSFNIVDPDLMIVLDESPYTQEDYGYEGRGNDLV